MTFGKKCESRRNVLDLKEHLKDSATRPTEMVQLVKRSPNFVGYTDAYATVMGESGFHAMKS